MSRNTPRTVLCLLSAVTALSLTGCPPSAFPSPPFDTSGDYLGDWTGEVEILDEKDAAITCPLSMTLLQDTSLGYPLNFGLAGAVEFDYDCFLPEWLLDLIGLELPALTIPVVGTLQADGDIYLTADVCIEEDLCVVFTLDGVGQDTDSDGAMDLFTGDFEIYIDIPEVPPIEAEGTFEVAAVDE